MRKYRVRYWEKVSCWRRCEDIITTDKEVNLGNIDRYYNAFCNYNEFSITNVNKDFSWDDEEIEDQDFTNAKIEEI